MAHRRAIGRRRHCPSSLVSGQLEGDYHGAADGGLKGFFALGRCPHCIPVQALAQGWIDAEVGQVFNEAPSQFDPLS
jgi:hypothetical protein